MLCNLCPEEELGSLKRVFDSKFNAVGTFNYPFFKIFLTSKCIKIYYQKIGKMYSTIVFKKLI